MAIKRFRKIVRRRRRKGEIAAFRVAIRNHCLECMGYDAAEIPRCTVPGCWLWPYRKGSWGGIDQTWPEELAESPETSEIR